MAMITASHPLPSLPLSLPSFLSLRFRDAHQQVTDPKRDRRRRRHWHRPSSSSLAAAGAIGTNVVVVVAAAVVCLCVVVVVVLIRHWHDDVDDGRSLSGSVWCAVVVEVAAAANGQLALGVLLHAHPLPPHSQTDPLCSVSHWLVTTRVKERLMEGAPPPPPTALTSFPCEWDGGGLYG